MLFNTGLVQNALAGPEAKAREDLSEVTALVKELHRLSPSLIMYFPIDYIYIYTLLQNAMT